MRKSTDGSESDDSKQFDNNLYGSEEHFDYRESAESRNNNHRSLHPRLTNRKLQHRKGKYKIIIL